MLAQKPFGFQAVLFLMSALRGLSAVLKGNTSDSAVSCHFSGGNKHEKKGMINVARPSVASTKSRCNSRWPGAQLIQPFKANWCEPVDLFMVLIPFQRGKRPCCTNPLGGAAADEFWPDVPEGFLENSFWVGQQNVPATSRDLLVQLPRCPAGVTGIDTKSLFDRRIGNHPLYYRPA